MQVDVIHCYPVMHDVKKNGRHMVNHMENCVFMFIINIS